MKLRGLSFLAIRVLAIYFFVQGLNHLVNYLDFALPAYLQVLGDNKSYFDIFLLVGIPSILLLIISIVLWFLAGKISSYFVQQDSSESESALSFRGAESFVLAVVGLVLAILSFTTLTRLILNYVNITNQNLYIDHRSYWISFGEHMIRLLLGLVLILKAEGFALLLRKIRGDRG